MFSLVGFPTDNRADNSRTESEKSYSDWLAAGSPMTGGLIACPAGARRDARLTLYPGVGHDSWTRTYDLAHRRARRRRFAAASVVGAC